MPRYRTLKAEKWPELVICRAPRLSVRKNLQKCGRPGAQPAGAIGMLECLYASVLQCRRAHYCCTRENPSVEAVAPSNARDSERDHRAQALFDGIDDAVFVHDPDGRILD